MLGAAQPWSVSSSLNVRKYYIPIIPHLSPGLLAGDANKTENAEKG